MCTYLGIKINKSEHIRLKAIEKELKNLDLNRPMQKGFDFKDWPVIVSSPDGNDWDIRMMHWEYIPPNIHDELQLKESRKHFMWLNARCENLFTNEKGRPSMWREGAMNGRCIVVCSHFYEFRHVAKLGKKGQVLKATDKVPYLVTIKDRPPYYFILGIYRHWENERRGSGADTFAIVTTQANEIMSSIHNSKLRMPTIVTEEMAAEWIRPDLSEARIRELACFQYPSEEMVAWPVENFLSASPDDYTLEKCYDNLPAL